MSNDTSFHLSAGREDLEVSVVIPAYNVESYIHDTLLSISGQSLASLEIIVVDDCSHDCTAAVVEKYASIDSRVRLLRLSANGGVSRARNAGIDLARGRWVAFVDSDDTIDPVRLATMIYEAERVGADWVADDQAVTGRVGEKLSTRVLRDEAPGCGVIDAAHLIARDPPERIGYGTLKALVRRRFLVDRGVRFRVGVERFEDFVFHVECGLNGAVMALVNKPLYEYVRRAESLSSLDPVKTLRGMLRQNELALSEADRMGNAEVAAALRLRERRVRAALDYRSLLLALRERRFRRMGSAVRDPAIGINFVRGLGRAAGRRLGVV